MEELQDRFHSGNIFRNNLPDQEIFCGNILLHFPEPGRAGSGSGLRFLSNQTKHFFKTKVLEGSGGTEICFNMDQAQDNTVLLYMMHKHRRYGGGGQYRTVPGYRWF